MDGRSDLPRRPMPEQLRTTLSPEAQAQWVDTLPFAVNLMRMTSGDYSIPPGLKHIEPRTRSEAASARTSDSLGALMASLNMSSSLGLEVDGKAPTLTPGSSTDEVTKLKETIAAMQSPKTTMTPISALKAQVGALLSKDLSIPLFIWHRISSAIDNGALDVHADIKDYRSLKSQFEPILWKSCKLATSILLCLAALQHKAQAALKFRSRTRGGMPTLSQIRTTPSESFRGAYVKAKEAVLKEGKTTIVAVSLTDVHIFELAARGKSESWFSFAHTFVAGFGPEGFVDGTRVRSWDEAESFTRDFTKLTTGKGQFDAKRKKLYHKLFDVDLFQVCGPKGPERPLVPRFEA
ncbi:uncharacterized protein BDZ99DRAFT_520334 [Mytilinidion resinicola]|uniref:Uncharacterized protein n=1 Tax=Mytilinidion resinicola TaxID=574789 RepID=A0A6A6YQJ2_9PEZI|nr:uncharacterized protein BDZ99DRAFT_520334 [Mytilinidion resinicola]KAF2810255.1 hypothetical protein BDZ99DRAFT_520334 [Mytilinidion resinicola]